MSNLPWRKNTMRLKLGAAKVRNDKILLWRRFCKRLYSSTKSAYKFMILRYVGRPEERAKCRLCNVSALEIAHAEASSLAKVHEYR